MSTAEQPASIEAAESIESIQARATMLRRIIELATAARELHILDVAEAALEWVELELEASCALAAILQSSPTEAAIRQRKPAWVIQKATNN